MDSNLKKFLDMDPLPHHNSYLVVDPTSGKFLDPLIKIFKTDPLLSKNGLPCYE